MCVQTFEVRHLHRERATELAHVRHRCSNTTRGIFTEHQILRISLCKRLFVFALYRGLNRRPKRGFHPVYDFFNRQGQG